MPLTDELIGSETVAALRRSLRIGAPDRPFDELLKATGQLGGLGLRQRADLLRDALLADVPGTYAVLADLVRRTSDRSPELRGWMIWPVTGAVAARAVSEESEEAFSDALSLLAELTERFSSEFAIRTLLRHDLDHALSVISGWTSSPNEHVRRLASEGTRPYLPWAVRVPELGSRPGVTIQILDSLYRDESEYVRRSVGNHLNDLSRDAPDLVVTTASRWLDEPDPSTPALARRALRTLVKRGHPGALSLLGFDAAPVAVDGPHIERAAVAFGGTVRFTATVRNTGTESARLAIDYVVHHQKANGAQTTKTFKLATRTLAPCEETGIDKEHSFRAITTRRYYPGPHAIALQVNGIAWGPAVFELLPPGAPAG